MKSDLRYLHFAGWDELQRFGTNLIRKTWRGLGVLSVVEEPGQEVSTTLLLMVKNEVVVDSLHLYRLIHIVICSALVPTTV
jgi:hypothetical protein